MPCVEAVSTGKLASQAKVLRIKEGRFFTPLGGPFLIAPASLLHVLSPSGNVKLGKLDGVPYLQSLKQGRFHWRPFKMARERRFTRVLAADSLGVVSS
jgi:hypothetical protein